MEAHSTTTTAPSSTSTMPNARKIAQIPLSKTPHAPASARTQLNNEDAQRLNVLITYQTSLEAKHIEPSNPRAELETLKQKTDEVMQKLKCQTTIEMARAEPVKMELAQESKKRRAANGKMASDLDQGMGKWFRRVEQLQLEDRAVDGGAVDCDAGSF